MSGYLLTSAISTIMMIVLTVVIIRELRKIKASAKEKEEDEEPLYTTNSLTGERVLVPRHMARKMHVVVYIIGLCFVIVGFCAVTIPSVLDYGYRKINGPIQATGTIDTIYYSTKKNSTDTVIIETDDGETLELTMEASDRKAGDYVDIEYLPYTKMGNIIRVRRTVE